MTTTQERIAQYLERRAAALEAVLKPDMDPEHCYASRVSQLRLEAANVRNGEWRKP